MGSHCRVSWKGEGSSECWLWGKGGRGLGSFPVSEWGLHSSDLQPPGLVLLPAQKDSDFQRKCILILLSASCGLSQPSSSLLGLQHRGFGGHCYLRKAKDTSKAGLGEEGEWGSSKGSKPALGVQRLQTAARGRSYLPGLPSWDLSYSSCGWCQGWRLEHFNSCLQSTISAELAVASAPSLRVP